MVEPIVESFENVKAYISKDRLFKLLGDRTDDIKVQGIFTGRRKDNEWTGYFSDESGQLYLIYPAGVMEIYDNKRKKGIK